MPENQMGKFKTWIARLLVGFVLVTIGFTLGRQTTPTTPPAEAGTTPPSVSTQTRPDKVVVYAAHMTFRCPECTQIEWLTNEVVTEQFAAELESGELEFQTVDYMQNAAFARRYDIASSTVVVSRIADGEETDFERLDEVWTRLRNRDDFKDYVGRAIRRQLEGG